MRGIFIQIKIISGAKNHRRGAPGWAQPTRARHPLQARPGGLAPPSGQVDPETNAIKSLQSFVPFRELLFLHKNNTMVVLLKTMSLRVSFIQIMQIKVQNKRKSIRKSRYDGDVSTPPSLNLCLSSSNSVHKLKVKKQNFYELFCPLSVSKPADLG